MDTEKSNLTIPVSIIVAGLLIAGSLFISRGGIKTNSAAVANSGLPNTESIDIAPVTPADHIQGNPQAPVLIVEYSDTECPFCKTFHTTMRSVMDTYGKDGKVAWVYRHFPLYKEGGNGTALHPKAGKEAEALECAAELGGNDSFWAYTNEIYTVTPSNNGLDPAELPKIAERVGLDVSKFNTCLTSGRYAQKVSDAYDAALKAGASGTPYSVIITSDGKTKVPVNGAQNLTSVKQVLDALLSAKN